MNLKKVFESGDFVGLPLKIVNLNSGSYKFPSKFIIITSLQHYSGDNVELSFITHDRKAHSISIPSNVEVEFLKGLTLTKLKKQYDAYMLKNLPNKLGHSCHIGADPEVFIENKNGDIIPAFEFLGSKKAPTIAPGTYHTNNTEAYWDGFQAEFTVDAGRCLAYRLDSMQAGLRTIMEKAKKYATDAKLSIKTVMPIPQNLLEGAKDKHVEFGCMPSYNAYNMKGRNVPARELPFRSTGGHIHFGYTKQSEYETIRIVKALDAILGVACVSLFEKYDDPKRRVMYGLAGEYRTPKHGLEYRVLSNAWLAHPLITNLVFDMARKAMVVGQKNILNSIWKYDEEEVVRIINECDVTGARKMLKVNKDIFLKLIKACYNFNEKNINIVYNIFYKGMDVAVKDCTDIEGNWKLNGSWSSHCDADRKTTQGSMKTALADGKKVS